MFLVHSLQSPVFTRQSCCSQSPLTNSACDGYIMHWDISLICVFVVSWKIITRPFLFISDVQKSTHWNPPQPQPPVYGLYTDQPVLAGTWKILLVQSFTARVPLLTVTSALGLGRRHWSSQQCYLHCLRTTSVHLKWNQRNAARTINFI